MPGEQSIASGACEATPKLALPPALPPSLSLCSVSLCLGINCGLLKCFLIEILPNFTLGDQVQPARSLCYANTLTLWCPAPSRRGEGKGGTANNNKQGSFCVSGQNAGAQQQQQGERTRTSGKAEKKVKAVKTSKVTGKASSAANVAVASNSSSSSRRQHIINFNVARESPTAATATASAAASVANSSLNPGLGLGLRLLPLFIHNFNSNSPFTSPSCLVVWPARYSRHCCCCCCLLG